MPLKGLTEILHRRRRRRDYRAMVKKWYADGGDERFRFDYGLDERSFVLDLGGYEGQWASDLYARHRCRIAIFEPVTRFAQSISARFRKNGDIAVFPCGLGATSRTETIYVHGASSSTEKKQAQAEQIEIVDVRQWFEDHKVEAVQLMKVQHRGRRIRAPRTTCRHRIDRQDRRHSSAVSQLRSQCLRTHGAVATRDADDPHADLSVSVRVGELAKEPRLGSR